VPIPIKKLLKNEYKTATQRIVDFLKRNRKYGYTSTEISKKLNMNINTVRSSLRMLVKKKLIRSNVYGRKRYYFA